MSVPFYTKPLLFERLGKRPARRLDPDELLQLDPEDLNLILTWWLQERWRQDRDSPRYAPDRNCLIEGITILSILMMRHLEGRSPQNPNRIA